MTDQADKQSKNDKTQDQSFKIKVDGQEVEVSRDELIELAQKGKDYTKKTQSLAEKEKALNALDEEIRGVKIIVDEMKANPKLNEALNKVYADFKSGKISNSETAKERNLKTIDRLIEETTDASQKENLREMRRIIKEETEDISTLKDEINNLKGELSSFKNLSLIGHSERINRDIDKLESEFGKELVEKYRKSIESASSKYPNTPIKKLFYNFVDDSELETAIANKVEKDKKAELDRKRKGADPSGGDVITPVEPPRDKKTGRVDIRQYLTKLKEAGKF